MTDKTHRQQTGQAFLKKLCVDIQERCVGSDGNRAAARFFHDEVVRQGWQVEVQGFDALDWQQNGAELLCGGRVLRPLVSPYSLGCELEAPLAAASSVDELARLAMRGKILLLHGEIAQEQLMPKNFKFYNPEEHQRIIALLESGAPAAIIAATGRNPSLAGGVYPFPLIEDGDFDIPSVYTTEEEGATLLPHLGQNVRLTSQSRRIPGRGENIIARRGVDPNRRIVITAHLDAKKGTPGAIDNATGVIVLMLLAELLADYSGEHMIEMVALNGEDYYAASGQMRYLEQNLGRFGQILFNINIDGAGFVHGKTALSFYDLPDDVTARARAVMARYAGLTEGIPWYQGDHSMFIQNGCPAIAISSAWFSEHIDSQDITHTPKDNVDIVDIAKVVEIAEAVNVLVRG